MSYSSPQSNKIGIIIIIIIIIHTYIHTIAQHQHWVRISNPRVKFVKTYE